MAFKEMTFSDTVHWLIVAGFVFLILLEAARILTGWMSVIAKAWAETRKIEMLEMQKNAKQLEFGTGIIQIANVETSAKIPARPFAPKPEPVKKFDPTTYKLGSWMIIEEKKSEKS